ncbi:flippase [Gluconacetobacter azotocaptans]|uniref:Flippase n=1 Tax=Gluconacetobacter azotocaptans TaxID=142834 RepID=A0A7W4JV68_9PROT|nr:flippase [Gluconacetobacter azotocaptans]MBB2191507.1 flippase [Gluconacetobacter azotocaptans]MBM9403025.1 flippase [Gluconacetobacter azotocaptans]
MVSPVQQSGPRPRHVITNAAWNMFGRIAPVLVALPVTPRLIHELGLSRWGIFTIALSLIGTFGIFDLGLGRALTRAIAGRTHDQSDHETADLILTGVLTLTGIGVIGGLISAGAVSFWVRHGLKIPENLQHETIVALLVFCATAPLVMINAALWGVLTAYHEFRATNLINIPISIAYYIGPLLVLEVWDSLVGVMLVLAGCRLWMAIAYIRFCLRLVPQLRAARVRPHLLAPLLRIGGWMTVSNIAYPLLGNIDRFMIASVISAAATGFYTTPSDAVGRFSMVTNAVAASAYPALASSWRTDSVRTVELYRTSVLTLAALLLPLCLGTALFSSKILSLWIDQDFAIHSSTIMKLLCLGIFIGSADAIAAGFLDAIGRPDASAKLSIGEMLVYVPLLVVFLHHFGVVGAAFAWAIRTAGDFVVRMFLSIRFYPPITQALARILPAALTGAACMCIALVDMPLPAATLFFGIAMAVFYGVLWFVCLDDLERDAAAGIVKRIMTRFSRAPAG